jgi:hypothetical protein
MASLPLTPNTRQGGAWLWCPESLDVDALVESLGQRVAEGVLLLGHFIFTALANDARCRDRRRVPLTTAHLRTAVGRHRLDAVRQAALDAGYVDRDRSYRAGERSQEYWVMPPHDSARLVRRTVQDSILQHNLGLWQEARRRETWQRIDQGKTKVPADVCLRLRQCLQKVRVDSGLDLGNGLHSAYQVAVEQLRNGNLWLAVDEYGRLHTNLSSFPKALRRFLTVDGKGLTCVDISESQPLFIGLSIAQVLQEASLRKQGRATHTGTLPYVGHNMLDSDPLNAGGIDRKRLPSDLRRYLELCEARMLYATLADRLGKTRDEAKKMFFSVVFDKPWHSNTTTVVLDGLFPTVMEAMRRIKRPNYRAAAHFAQGVESAFVYRQVVPRIMAERPGLWIGTIHDAVLCPAGDGEWVRQVMLGEFAKLGLRPQVRVEPC